MSAENGERQRLDKWLWFARLFKSRTLAQKFIASGAVRVDKLKIDRTDYRVGPGTVLTFVLNHRIRVLRVVNPGQRRGPASEAQTLYEDLSPEHRPEPGAPVPNERPRGSRQVTRRRL